MIAKHVSVVIVLIILSCVLTACLQQSQPIKHQPVIEPKSALIKTDTPGAYLNEWLRHNPLLERTLVILDLDDTLITSPQGQWLGRPKLFYDYLAEEQAAFPDKTKKQIAETIDPLLDKVYNRIPVALTDAEIPAAINEFKQRGALVIGLTSRGIGLLDTTLAQLNKLGIVFSDITVKTPLSTSETSNPVFVSGLAMAGHDSTKGEVLKALIEFGYLSDHFSQMIMIDDTLTHLENVGQVLSELVNTIYTPVLCLYPQKVAQYNSQVARQQLKTFLTLWQDDPEIKQLIETDYFTRKVFFDEKGDTPHP